MQSRTVDPPDGHRNAAGACVEVGGASVGVGVP
jgi:hypothetical protein